MAASAPPSTTALPPVIPSAATPLPPKMGAPGVTQAWRDHVAAGHIGAVWPPAEASGGDRGLAGLLAIVKGVTRRRLP